MSIEYYIGPYLEVSLNTVKKEKVFRACPNHGFTHSNDKFCSECGSKIEWRQDFLDKYPYVLDDILPYDDFVDEFIDVWGNSEGSVILLLTNHISNKGPHTWLDGEEVIMNIPSSDEIAEMKLWFLNTHTIAIDLLNASELVKRCAIKVGIVSKEW